MRCASRATRASARLRWPAFTASIVGAALMIAIGLVGIYVGYIFQEVKRRPVYLLRAVHDSRGDRRPDAGGDTAQ